MAGVEQEEESIGALVGRVVEDTRDLVGAELALYKARVGERIGAYKSAIAFFAVAGILALAALIALLVGLILTIATRVGPGYSTAIVVGAVLIIAVVLGLIGKTRLTPPQLPDIVS